MRCKKEFCESCKLSRLCKLSKHHQSLKLLLIALLFGLIAWVLMASIVSAKQFIGEVKIQPVGNEYNSYPETNPEKDLLSVCTDDLRYRVKPGGTVNFLLYVKNPIENRTYYDLYVSIPSENFTFVFSDDYKESLGSQEVWVVNVTGHIPKDTPYGKYPVNIIVTTRDYPVGGFIRTRDIIVTHIWKWEYEAMVALSLLILIVLVVRHFWIRRVNRLQRMQGYGVLPSKHAGMHEKAGAKAHKKHAHAKRQATEK
jgi:hypothetical protein